MKVAGFQSDYSACNLNYVELTRNANQSERPKAAPQSSVDSDGFMQIPDDMEELPFS